MFATACLKNDTGFQAWIPACAGMTEVGEIGLAACWSTQYPNTAFLNLFHTNGFGIRASGCCGLWPSENGASGNEFTSFNGTGRQAVSDGLMPRRFRENGVPSVKTGSIRTGRHLRTRANLDVLRPCCPRVRMLGAAETGPSEKNVLRRAVGYGGSETFFWNPAAA